MLRRIALYAFDLAIARRDGKPLPDFQRTEPVKPEVARRLAGKFSDGERTLELVPRGGELYAWYGVVRARVRARGDTLVIYTPAVPQDHPVFRFFLDNDYTLFKRAEVLGMISDRMRPVAVAGTHGKTTTSTMIAHILKQSVLDCTAFLGGISKNYDTNLLLGESPWVVLEADEYDRSFLHLHPSLAVITSMDADHLDIYGDHAHLRESFHQFMGQVREGGKILVHNSLEVNRFLP